MKNIAERLHHVAYITWDMAKTAEFWTQIMGLKLVGHVANPRVPSTGEEYPYLHMFFGLGDGSDLAFFEVRNVPTSSQETGISKALKHISFEVVSEAELNEYRERLEKASISYSGPEEDSFNRFITFFDPNEIKVQIALPLKTNRTIAPEEQASDTLQTIQKWQAHKQDMRLPLGISSAIV